MLLYIKLFLIKADYTLKNRTLSLFKLFLFKNQLQHQEINSILIFRTGSLGDSIVSMPAIESIKQKYPKANIDILTDSGGKSLVSINNLINNEGINKFIFYKSKPVNKLIKELRHKYDLFILLPQTHATFISILRNLFFAKLIGCKYAIGFKVCVTRLFPQTQARHLTLLNIREFLLSILNNEGIETIKYKNTYNFKIAKDDISFVNNLFEKENLADNIVSLVVGAKRPQHRWPVQYFDKITDHLLSKGYQCILIGGKEDKETAKQLTNYNKITDLTGELTPIQSGLAISKCKICITNDTGPMHLSYSFGTRTIALFSSRDYPNLWFPPKELSSVFRNDNISCSECFTETCTDNQCMKQIIPEVVISKLDKELNNK